MVAPAGPGIGKTKDAQVMGALKSKAEVPPGKQGGMDGQKWMNSAQIITKFFTQSLGSEEKAKQMINVIASKVQKKEVKLVQLGNTVFVVYPRPDKSAEFYTISVEPKNLPKRIETLFNTLKQMGFIKMYTLSITPESNKIAEETNLPFKRIQSQMMSGKQMVPAYRYEVAL
jgi:hypothetical protein